MNKLYVLCLCGLFLRPAAAVKADDDEQGAQGPKGDKGDRGDVGPRGPQGPQGVPGYGYPGAPGVPGRDGVTGKPGKDGSAGKDGASGKDGARGADATVRTSVNVEVAVRLYDARYYQVQAYDTYNVREAHNGAVGLRFLVKVGRSYEQRRLDELEERIKGLENSGTWFIH